MMMEPNIVVLAGGISSRMRKSLQDGFNPANAELHRDRPKAMMPVGAAGKPFLDYLLTTIEQAGYRNIVVVVGEHDEYISRYYLDEGGAKAFPQLSFCFVEQPIPSGRTKPLGTADALLRTLLAVPHHTGQRFTVCNSDNLYSRTALRLLLNDDHRNSMIVYNRDALDFPPERIEQFSVVTTDEEGYLTDIIEKPTADELARASDMQGHVGVSMNLWRFSREDIQPFLDAVPLHPVRQEKELSAAVRLMIERHPKSVWTFRLSEHVPDLTSVADLASVQDYLRKHFP